MIEPNYTNDGSLVDAEASICGAILRYPQRAMAVLPEFLTPDDFRTVACSAVLEAVLQLKKKRRHIDEIAIRNQVLQNNATVTEDNYEFMKALGISPAIIPDRAVQIHEFFLRRQLREACQEVLNDERTPLSDLLRSSSAKFNQLYTMTGFEPLTQPASSFAYEEPKWLIEPYFQRGKGTLIQADPGVGKTAFMCAIAAAVTNGRGFLGLTVQTPGNVVMLSVEDDPGVLRGRLEAGGADLERVFFVNDAGKLSLNSPEIEKIIVQTEAKMIVFDPFQAFLGQKVDLFRANETRPILSALFETCARHDCACVIIAHLGKNTTGKSAVNQSLGSVDIPGAMRSILHIVRDPRLDGQLMAVQIKSSNASRGKTIAYSIGKRGSVNWLELTDDTLDTILGARKEEEKSPYEQNPLLPILLHMRDNNHPDGFWSYEEVKQLCREKLGYVPFRDSRSLPTLLPKDFLEELEQREGIQLRLQERYSHSRGLRLYTAPKIGACAPEEPNPPTADEYQEMMDILNHWDTP